MISPEQVGERFLTVHHRMRRAVDEGMTACGLTLTRTKVLDQLHRRGPTRPGVLATEFGVAPRTITDIVDGLERDGLATRHADPADRRASLVALTREGDAALAVAGAERERLLQHVFGSLDASDRATLVRLLDILDDAAAALIAGAASPRSDDRARSAAPHPERQAPGTRPIPTQQRR
jgi:DNA-binding MarR family transcriptional regulator